MAETKLFREVLYLLLAPPSPAECGRDIVNLFQLLSQYCPYLGHRDVRKLREDLQSCTLLFKVKPNDSSYTVFPTTSLTICPRHSNKSGSCPDGTCPDLHFCTFFLLCGQCRYGEHCRFGHDLRTRHNRPLLNRHFLAGIRITHLRTLFCVPQVRQGVTIPQVCRDYNMPEGCSKGSECCCLHLCLDNILRKCESADDCERNHDISHSQVSNVLSMYGVRRRDRPESHVLQEVRFYHHAYQTGRGRVGEPDHRARTGRRAPPVSRRMRHASGSADTRRASRQSISIKGGRGFKGSCKRLHCSDGPLWRLTPEERLLESDAVTEWTSLPPDSNQTLEEAFCQPKKTECIVTNERADEIKVNFHNMTAKNMRTTQRYKVHRLSIHGGDSATVWVWYWKNPNGWWQEFGREENGRLAGISETVELNFEMAAGEPIEFGHFVLDFAKMQMKDVDNGRKFKVRSRPLPVPRNHDAGFDWDNSDEEGSQGDSDSDSDDDSDDQAGTSNVISDDDKDDEARASHVSTPAVPVENILSPVRQGTEVYTAVLKRFRITLGKACTVAAIHRVVNPQLEARYQKMKLSMKTRCRRRDIEEKELYYRPTRNEDVTEIYTNGANCDNPPVTVNGRNLGRGGFFCVTAREANKGVESEKEGRMFLMKCLVSRHTAAQSSAQGYGCRVDNDVYPMIFVIENPSQTCPLYLITYSLP